MDSIKHIESKTQKGNQSKVSVKEMPDYEFESLKEIQNKNLNRNSNGTQRRFSKVIIAWQAGISKWLYYG